VGAPMARAVRVRLSLMMALVYAVQGAWWPLLAVHLIDLGVPARGRGWIFATMALAAVAAPVGAGQLADRVLATQRLLALIYVVSTGFLVAMAQGWVQGSGRLFAFFLAYWILVVPTYGLSNALAFRNLPRAREQFGTVRLWGTVGWMVVGWSVALVLLASGSDRAGRGAYEAFWVAAGLSALLSAYCLTLPATPPLDRGGGDRGPGELSRSLELVRQPAVARYLATAFCVSLTTPFVYQVMPQYFESLGLSRAGITVALTLGQFPEIAALAALPALLRRIGYRGTLAVGMGAWAVRYASLAVRPPLWLAIAGIPLHGVAIACFTIAGQMYLDSKAPPERRGTAQGLNMVVSTGVGSFLGNLLAGELVGATQADFAIVFLVPTLINVGLLVGWWVASRRRSAGA